MVDGRGGEGYDTIGNGILALWDLGRNGTDAVGRRLDGSVNCTKAFGRDK